MKDKFKDRLSEAIKHSRKQQKQIALECRISEARLSAYVRGVNLPPIDVLVDLCKTLNITSDWLLGLNEADGSLDHGTVSLFGATVPRNRYDDLDPDQLAELDRFADYLRSRQQDVAREKTAPRAAC